MIDIYDHDGNVDRAKVMDRLSEIIDGTEAAITVLGWGSARAPMRQQLVFLLEACSDALPADHECIGQEEAEHMHDVMMWERQHGKSRRT